MATNNNTFRILLEFEIRMSEFVAHREITLACMYPCIVIVVGSTFIILLFFSKIT
jgi:hypothetical protein